jgi:hypothetical protein
LTIVIVATRDFVEHRSVSSNLTDDNPWAWIVLDALRRRQNEFEAHVGGG